MYKNTVRAFSLGIVFSVSILGIGFFSLEEPGKETTLAEAKKVVEKEGYTILTNKDYENMKNAAALAKKTSSLDETSKKEENQATPPQKQSTKSEEKSKETITYTLEIQSGMNTEEIARTLMDASIIDDDKDFEQFLTDEGYSTIVQVGTFELNNNMTYDEIARSITKS
jgi:hypothetical protein